MTGTIPACFKAYDIRGRVPDELYEDLAHRIGLATARFLGAQRMAVGRDCRLSSGGLAAATARVKYLGRMPCLCASSSGPMSRSVLRSLRRGSAA